LPILGDQGISPESVRRNLDENLCDQAERADDHIEDGQSEDACSTRTVELWAVVQRPISSDVGFWTYQASVVGLYENRSDAEQCAIDAAEDEASLHEDEDEDGKEYHTVHVMLAGKLTGVLVRDEADQNVGVEYALELVDAQMESPAACCCKETQTCS